jgi:Flp pilus assembly protein TadG
MHIQARQNSKQEAQRGVAVIEFALVFTVVWAVFWSLICYVAPLIVLQTMHRASAEGARVGAMIDSVSLRKVQAEAAANEELKSLPASWRVGVTAVATVCADPKDDEPCLLTITITQPYAANAPLKPIINLPGIGTIPALPVELRSEASLLLN